VKTNANVFAWTFGPSGFRLLRALLQPSRLRPGNDPLRNFSVLAGSRATSDGNTFLGIFLKHRQFSAQNKFVLQHVFKKWNGRNIIQATCYCLRRLAEKCLDEYGGEVTS